MNNSGPEPKPRAASGFLRHLNSQLCRVAATDVLTCRVGKGATMDERRFDALTKTIGNESGSRRRAVQVIGAALASAGLLAHVSGEATAGKAQKRCKNKGGTWLPAGECHCSVNSSHAFDLPSCNGDASCRCAQTASGRGFCARLPAAFIGADCICNGCPANQACIALPGNPQSGRECITTKECVTIVGTGYGCVNGRCEFTACVEPCPTQL